MITYTTSKTENELLGILELQKKNLPTNLTEEEIFREGFVTVVHNFDALKKMNDIEQHVIAKDGDKVIAYLLAMTSKSKGDIPVLLSMFENFDKITFQKRKLSDCNYIVVGQVCVAKDYRGLGILDSCYDEYKKKFQKKYDFAITEIALKNQRSINAHKRIGFREIYRFTDEVEWSIVVWEW
jgi:ribosomal protein S18 acetylase RimI-like enzyme